MMCKFQPELAFQKKKSLKSFSNYSFAAFGILEVPP
jgi:hypothetical protein